MFEQLKLKSNEKYEGMVGGGSLQLNCLNGPRHFLPWKISGVKVKMKLENDRNIQYRLYFQIAQNFSGNQWPDPHAPQINDH